jgi:branched-chain amino acid transport system substrate-binding protein
VNGAFAFWSQGRAIRAAASGASVTVETHCQYGATYILPKQPEGAGAQAFRDKYKARYNRDPELFAAEAYDALMLIDRSLSNVPEPSSDSLKNALYKVQDYDGASGIISFDANGDVTKPMVVKRVVNGKGTIVTSTK